VFQVGWLSEPRRLGWVGCHSPCHRHGLKRHEGNQSDPGLRSRRGGEPGILGLGELVLMTICRFRVPEITAGRLFMAMPVPLPVLARDVPPKGFDGDAGYEPDTECGQDNGTPKELHGSRFCPTVASGVNRASPRVPKTPHAAHGDQPSAARDDSAARSVLVFRGRGRPSSTNSIETELRQYRSRVGGGPSGKTCPR
jgi:hypothetical protein